MKKEALLYEKLANNQVHCFLCAHHCRIADTKFGFCGVRQNIGGALFTHVYGNIIASHIDPVEKKPLYHFLPGSFSYSIASPGCNFRCQFCQNWEISQVKIPENVFFDNPTSTPEQVVKNAIENNCKSISFTYTEPTVYFEFVYETALLAKKNDIKTILVSNGYFSEKMIEKIAPYLDACNIDLKSFSDNFYKKICKAHVEPVKSTLKLLHENHIWTEITTLLVTGENDSVQELNNIAEFIYGINPSIPWHVSRYFPRYKMKNNPTPAKTIEQAVSIGFENGLMFVYAGNTSIENATICPECKKEIIVREGFDVVRNLVLNGKCSLCATEIPGIWE